MTLNDLEPQNRFFVNVSRFQAAIHILRVNCADTVKNRPGQPANEMFGIKRRIQRCKARPPRFKESSVRVHQMGRALHR